MSRIKRYSPLRYPGGKGALYPLIASIVKKYDRKIYIEPFAGGAEIALSLLINNDVDEVLINDYDIAIYSMWRAITTEPCRFLELLEKTEVTVEEWYRQKEIYKTGKDYSLELGFATFFLNRANRSGILGAGVIGGLKQSGNYKIDARFNKKDLTQRIEVIAKHSERIFVCNYDVRNLLCFQVERAFMYLDPPYVKKGKQLYREYFTQKDHEELFNLVDHQNNLWVITYDDAKEIKSLYKRYPCWSFSLVYSAANTGENTEIMFSNEDNLFFGVNDSLLNKINLRQIDKEEE